MPPSGIVRANGERKKRFRMLSFGQETAMVKTRGGKNTKPSTARTKKGPPSTVGVPYDAVVQEDEQHEESGSGGEPGDKSSVSSLEDTSEEEKDEIKSVATPILKKKSSSKKPPATTPGSTASSRSKKPTRDNARSLPETVQKPLAEGIESRGGLVEFFKQTKALHNFCESDTATFGIYNSERRKQVQNKTRQWRDLPEEDYHRVIFNLQVVPASCRSVTQAPAPAAPRSTPNLKPAAKKPSAQKAKKDKQEKQAETPKSFFAYRENTQDDSGSEDSQPNSSRQLFPPLRVTVTPSTSPEREKKIMSHRSVSSRGSSKKTLDEAKGAFRLEMNVDEPEMNLIVCPVPFYNFDWNGHDYQGYDITFRGDLRHFKKLRYRMKVHKDNKNEIIFERPALDHILEGHKKDTKAYERQEQDEAVAKGHRVFIENLPEERKKQKFLLVFPSGCELSFDPFREAGKPMGPNQWFEGDLFPIAFKTGDVDANQKEIVSIDGRVSFKCIDTETGVRHTSNRNKTSDKMARAMEGLDMNDSDSLDMEETATAVEEDSPQKETSDPGTKRNKLKDPPEAGEVVVSDDEDGSQSMEVESISSAHSSNHSLIESSDPTPVVSSLQRSLVARAVGMPGLGDAASLSQNNASSQTLNNASSQTLNNASSQSLTLSGEAMLGTSKKNEFDRRSMFKSQPNSKEARETFEDRKRKAKKSQKLFQARMHTPEASPLNSPTPSVGGNDVDEDFGENDMLANIQEGHELLGQVSDGKTYLPDTDDNNELL